MSTGNKSKHWRFDKPSGKLEKKGTFSSSKMDIGNGETITLGTYCVDASVDDVHYEAAVAGKEIEQYIVTNVFEDKWFYFDTEKQAKRFASALKLHESNCTGCNQTIVKMMRDGYIGYANPADYHCRGYITTEKTSKIEIYKGNQVFTGMDNDLGKVLVKARNREPTCTCDYSKTTTLKGV